MLAHSIRRVQRQQDQRVEVTAGFLAGMVEAVVVGLEDKVYEEPTHQ